jgi:hypothetical protein
VNIPSVCHRIAQPRGTASFHRITVIPYNGRFIPVHS